jgi:HlyD family secretion protein
MRNRRLLLFVAIALVLAAGVGIWRWKAGGNETAFHFETTKADQGSIVAKVTATGTLSAIVTVTVGSQVSGTIQALYADYNSLVKKGQLIAKIDPQLFQATVEQARANNLAAQGNLAKAKAQAVDARRQAERNKALFERQLIARADMDTSQSNAEAAEAGVQAAAGAVAQTRAALHQAEVNLQYTSILSPTNGVVISRSVDVGQTVAASLQAPTLFVIAEDLAKMQVDTSVAEADVGRLRDGMPASFTVDAFPSEVFKGAVRQVRNAPQTVQNVVTYDAVVDVSNPKLKLKPGMTANVTFVYAEKENVVRVPNSALRFRAPPALLATAQGGGADRGRPRAGRNPSPVGEAGEHRPATEPPDRRTVWVLRGESATPVRIQTGISDGSTTEVVEGLQAGDLVITDATGGPSGTGGPGGPGGPGRRGGPPRMF